MHINAHTCKGILKINTDLSLESNRNWKVHCLNYLHSLTIRIIDKYFLSSILLVLSQQLKQILSIPTWLWRPKITVINNRLTYTRTSASCKCFSLKYPTNIVGIRKSMMVYYVQNNRLNIDRIIGYEKKIKES